MRKLLRTSAGLWLLSAVAAAQLIPGPPPARRNPGDLPIPSSLYHAWLEREQPLEVLRERAGPGFVDVDEARRIHVEIVAPRGGLGVPDSFVQRFGGSVENRSMRRVEAWVPLDFLLELTRALPQGQRLVRPSPGVPDDITGEGPAVTGSLPWKLGGANGAGKTIAVIDSGWAGLDMAIANGDAPGSYTAINYTSSGFQAGSVVHGTGCLEQVFDHAPGATYRLYKVDALVDYADVIKDCQAKGVDIISRSLSTFNDSWWDDESELCESIAEAGNTGIVWFNSSGNYADRHWEGLMNAGQGSPDWHDWQNGDELLGVTLADGESLQLYLLWDDDPAGSEDYDLFLYDTFLNVIASSTSPFEVFEELSWTNTTGGSVLVQVAVKRFSGAATTFELYGDKGQWEYSTSASSVPPGTSCSHPNYVVVGAVDQSQQASPPGTTGIATSYSSRGPTNSGHAIIDVMGPTNTTCLSYPGGFNGTSCSTPNVAGMAACLWSSTPAYGNDVIRWLVERHGEVFRDWGPAGYDHTYGFGGVSMIDFHKDTRWLTEEFPNPNGLTSKPANDLVQALAQTPSGGRIVAFPGGFYPPDPILLAKPVMLVSRGASALFSK